MSYLVAPWAEVVELHHAPAIGALLRRATTEGRPVHLSRGERALGSTRLLAYDALRRRLSLELQDLSPHLPAVLEAPDLLATAYMLGAQLQFELRGLLVAHSAAGRTLQAAQPSRILRINRRRSPRLQLAGSPVVWLQAVDAGNAAASLPLLDLSEHGCALLWRADAPPPLPGTVFPTARLALDATTQWDAGMELLHATRLHDTMHTGQRLGFRFTALDGATAELLKHVLERGGTTA